MIKLCAFADEASSSLEGQIKALNENNIPYLEVRGINGKSVAGFTAEEAKEYQKQLSDNGLAVWSVGSALGKVDIACDFEDYKNTVRHVCEMANIFKTDKIRIFSFYKAYEERNKVIDYLSQMVEIGKEYGVLMCHENEKGIYGDVADRCVDVLDNVKDLKCVYDPANFIQCDEKADKTLALLHNRAIYFHIKDVIEATQQIVPAGYGDGKIDKLIADISDDKVLTLEPHLSAFVGYKNIDDTEMKHKFSFANAREAFDAAVKATKDILIKTGYKEINGEFVK
ncbi:MAG: sugar phosphate isomerase/epimerase [Clostridiales bacterium]|nr:sugar phosphate isomerase/epimerase [Clostridiales bacterium]